MKRYFTSAVQPGTTAFHCDSVYHWMSLEGGGFVIVMMDGAWDPDPAWSEMPHLLENTAANFNGVNHTAGAFVATAQQIAAGAPQPIAGVTHTDNTFQVAKKLATINRLFHP